jgi:hypothetical protein
MQGLEGIKEAMALKRKQDFVRQASLDPLLKAKMIAQLDVLIAGALGGGDLSPGAKPPNPDASGDSRRSDQAPQGKR